MKVVTQNKKAFHDYHIDEKVEAGVVLLGTEVKSLRAGRANLTDGYVEIKGKEAFMHGSRISPYSHGNIMNHEPERVRKLLLHKAELEKLRAKVERKGYTLIPLKLYFKGHLVKVEVGLARGKRLFEKRDGIKAKEAKKEIERALKTSRV